MKQCNIYSVPRRYIMVKLRVLEILEEQHKSKYWLYKRMDLTYQNFSRMVNNETKSIKYDNIDKMMKLLK